MELVSKKQYIKKVGVFKRLFHYHKTYTPHIYEQIWQYITYMMFVTMVTLPQLFAANKERSTREICDEKAESL